MSRNPRYDILFEPVRIGPVVAPNRFYQTPHAVGTGNDMPHTRAAIREVRAEGGWGVVNTGYCSIHPSSDDSPLNNGRLWDDADIATYRPMVEAVHRHGALAGIELWHGGSGTGNRYSRAPLLSASGIDAKSTYPGWMNLNQSRAMDKSDITALRRWHVDAAKRARRAGFDIIYIYSGMNFGPYQFLLPWLNQRSDEYGGSLENRVRLTREILEDIKEAVGQDCAVALRFSSSELLQLPGEISETAAHDVIGLLAELPDLWDIKSSDWTVETQSARFTDSGAQEPWTKFVKPLTSKPVVGVGRFTSPDEMVSQIKRGVLDLIGAARPSIADPFLPEKINQGREEDIRECIGCNICVASYHDGVPLRCTQNPTMGEEWRRGWHPERIAPAESNKRILVVGGGPAGLECARVLSQRGYAVTLAEAGETLGGRVSLESRLPGLSSWARVRDYRVHTLQQMDNVDIFLGHQVSHDDVINFDSDHTIIATGAHWTRQIMTAAGLPGEVLDADNVFTPDDLLRDVGLQGHVLVYDFDHYYMGGCIAESLRQQGCAVTLVTPAEAPSPWTFLNNDKAFVRQRLIAAGIDIVTDWLLLAFDGHEATLANLHEPHMQQQKNCDAVVVVGSRTPNDALYDACRPHVGVPLTRIGDCISPGIIAHAVYSGHELARTLDVDLKDQLFRRERPQVDPLLE